VKLIAISRSQARREPAKVSAVVHHGLDPSRFHRLPEQGYLLFLGRYDRVKASPRPSRSLCGWRAAGDGGAPHEREYYQESRAADRQARGARVGGRW